MEPAYIEALKAVWERLPEGQIAFEPGTRMRQGQRKVVTARLTTQPDLDVLAGLSEDYVVQTIKTSGVMGLYLEGSEEEFLIDPINSPEQALVGDFNEWRWWVTALKAGRKQIVLRVVAKIHLPGEVMTTDLLVREAIVEVDVDRWWSTKRFVGLHWQWLLGSPVVLGGVAWVAKRLRKEKSKRSAGF
jgi:hypothetical protein